MFGNSIDNQQHFTTGNDRAKVAALFNGAVGSIDCDAVVTILFPNMSSLETTFADPDLSAKLQPDEKLFIEDDWRMMIGKEYIGIRK